MRRLTLNIFSTLSLLAALISGAAWLRSYFYVDEASYSGTGSRWEYYFVSYPGQLFIQLTRDDDDPNSPAVSGEETWRLGPSGFPVAVDETIDRARPMVLGFACYWDSIPESTVRPLSIKIPYWILPILFIAVPAFRIGRAACRRIASRRRGGLCPNCAYDLRAHKPGDKCPECGTPVAAKSATMIRDRSTP